MTNNYDNRGNYHSKIITVNGDDYLWQGRDDKILMVRRVEDVLECERTPVNKMLGGRQR